MNLFCNGKEFDVEQGESLAVALKEEIERADRDIIACNFNNEIKSLNYVPKESGKVDLLDYTDTEGKRVYVRGIMYIMAMAIDELYQDVQLTINYQLDNSMFCTFEKLEITDEVIANIKKKMQEIIAADLPITKIKMTQEEAEAFYEKERTLRGILQIDMESKEKVSLYYCKDYYNYFYGVMPISTGCMKVFDLVKYSKGYLLRYPSKKDPTRLQEFRDNKKLMSTLQEYEDIHAVLKLNTIYRLNTRVAKDERKRNNTSSRSIA